MTTPLIHRAGFHWHLPADLAGPLLGPAGLRLDEWLAAGQAVCVKHAPHRSVYRVRLPGADLHVKHYRDDGRERIRRLFRSTRGRAEFDLGAEVARRGVPTLEVLGWGETASPWRAADSFLVTRTRPGAVSLLDYLQTAPPPPVQHRLAAALGEFLAAVHRAGVRHTDLHPGNVLLEPDGEACRLFLIDLLAVRLGGPLSWPESRRNLVVLNRWFALRAARPARLRAWKAYLAHRADLSLDARAAAREVETATRASLLAFTRLQDRRCLGGNRHFRRLRGPGLRGHAVSDLPPDVLGPLLADPDAPFDNAARVLKHSATSTVIELAPSFVHKRIRATRWTDPLAALFRPAPALHAYRAGHELRLRGLPTPRPLAVWHRCRAGLPGDGYLLVERLPGARTLGEFVGHLATLPEGERRDRLHRLLDGLAGVLRSLHEWRLSHRDLKAANLLVSPTGWTVGPRGVREVPPQETPPGETRDHVWLVDLAGVRRCARLTRGRRVSDLARLHVSFLEHPGLTRSDRLRFLRTYLRWGLHGKGDWKDWWRRIERAAREKVARNRRRGRIVG